MFPIYLRKYIWKQQIGRNFVIKGGSKLILVSIRDHVFVGPGILLQFHDLFNELC